MGQKNNAPFRFDYVGSFLRPEALKYARAAFAAEKISVEELREAEDQAVTELIEKQKQAGFHTLTDGEFRRSTWHLDFMWGFQGVAHERVNGNESFRGEVAQIDDVYITDRITAEDHPFVQHFRFVKAQEDAQTIARQTLPSPGQFYAQFTGRTERMRTLAVYPSVERFADDVVDAYIRVLRDLYEAGCRNVQFDDCTWGALVNPRIAEALSGVEAKELPRFMELLVDLNNRVIAEKPEDLVVNTHVCRGNYHSTFFSQGAYDRVAPYLFGKENVNAYYLEFDDARSGGFESLAEVSGDKKVVLGLITTKRPELEKKADVIDRIHEAARYIPLDRLYLSPQCGFASTEIGNVLTEEEQWEKLALVKEIAEEVWGGAV